MIVPVVEAYVLAVFALDVHLWWESPTMLAVDSILLIAFLLVGNDDLRLLDVAAAFLCLYIDPLGIIT